MQISNISFQLLLIIYRLKEAFWIMVKSFKRQDIRMMGFHYLASNLYDIIETFGRVLMKMILTSVCLFFFLRWKIWYSLISQTLVGLLKQLNAFFEKCTKYNLKINHNKCKVMGFSSRKYMSSWYAQGVKFNAVKFLCDFKLSST